MDGDRWIDRAPCLTGLVTDGSSGSRPSLRRRQAREGSYALEIPISKQFTPEQIKSLRGFLTLVSDHGPETGGTYADARARVRDRLFAAQRRGGTQAKRLTQAGNAISSARYWGLLNDDFTLTDVARRALAATDDDRAAEVLVEHFLRYLGGAPITKAIFDVIAANDGVAPEKTALATALHRAGIYENRDGTDHAAVLAWLAHPGARVVVKQGRTRWSLEERRFAELAGITPVQVDAVTRRHPVQLALLVELARTEGGHSDVGAMLRLLAVRADLDVNAPGFRRLYLDPLAHDGLIEIAPRRRGAGATAFTITDLGRSAAVEDLISRFDATGTLGYRAADLLRPTREIVADLDRSSQPDPNRRAIALEQLAIRMLDWIGLTDARWRVRPGRNAEEIDGTAQALLPSFARWQVQAKNTARLNADDAAKEIGLALVNGAAVVMLITTGRFTAPARSVIERAERRGGLAFICLDGDDVRDIAHDSAQLHDKLDRESTRARARHDDRATDGGKAD
jgi:hypothetical protein